MSRASAGSSAILARRACNITVPRYSAPWCQGSPSQLLLGDGEFYGSACASATTYLFRSFRGYSIVAARAAVHFQTPRRCNARANSSSIAFNCAERLTSSSAEINDNLGPLTTSADLVPATR